MWIGYHYTVDVRADGTVPPLDPGPVLDFATAFSPPKLCVVPQITATSWPALPTVGAPNPVQLTVGLSFAGAAPVFRSGVLVDIVGQNLAPGATTGVTDAAGRFTASLVPSNASHRLDITATLPGRALILADAQQAVATIVRSQVQGVTVTPPQVTLQPGQAQQFSAAVAGTSNQSVTWALSGTPLGTLSPSGLFTAGPVSGTVFVTATSVEDPSVVGVAQVTIGTPPAVLPASVTLLLQATRSNTSATCTPQVGFGGQVSIAGPLPLSGAVSCTDGTAGSASIAANGATVAWSGSMHGVVNPVTQATAILNVVSSFELTPAAGTVTLTVNPDWSSVHFNARISAEYGPTTVTAWTGRDAAGILDTSLPLTASLPVTPVPGQVLIVRVLQACLGECVGSGTFATVTLPQ